MSKTIFKFKLLTLKTKFIKKKKNLSIDQLNNLFRQLLECIFMKTIIIIHKNQY